MPPPLAVCKDFLVCLSGAATYRLEEALILMSCLIGVCFSERGEKSAEYSQICRLCYTLVALVRSRRAKCLDAGGRLS